MAVNPSQDDWTNSHWSFCNSMFEQFYKETINICVYIIVAIVRNYIRKCAYHVCFWSFSKNSECCQSNNETEPANKETKPSFTFHCTLN